MSEKINVVKIEDLKETVQKTWIPLIAEEIIKRTDKRYFTRTQIYAAGILALWICASFIIVSLVKYPQIVPNMTRPIETIKEIPKETKKPGA